MFTLVLLTSVGTTPSIWRRGRVSWTSWSCFRRPVPTLHRQTSYVPHPMIIIGYTETNIVRKPPNDHYWLYRDKHCTYDTQWSLLAKQRPTSYELFDHYWLYRDKHCTYDTLWSLLTKQRPTSYELFDHYWLYKDKHRTYATRWSLLAIQRDKHRTYDTQWLLLTIQRQTLYVRHPMIIIDQTETNIVRTPPNDYYWPYRDKHRMYATQWSLLTLKRQPS